VVARLRREIEGRTLVLVTHRPALIGLADRVVVLEAGRVAFDGSPQALMERAGGGSHGA
jgi:ATP-binding cassette subfamily C protein LapB